MAIDQFLSFEVGHDVAGDRALVDLGHHVMDGLAIAECLVDRGVEAVEETQLELVGALEEVLQVTGLVSWYSSTTT